MTPPISSCRSSSDFYYAARPNLAIAKDAALPLDSDWGLHPALKDSDLSAVAEQADRLCALCRHRRHLRSHFETQDTIELGQPVGGSRNYQSGFMTGADGLNPVKPFEFQELMVRMRALFRRDRDAENPSNGNVKMSCFPPV